MNYKKRLLLVSMLGLLIFMLSGCVKMAVNVKVNPNKSADVDATLLVNSFMTQLGGDKGFNLEDIKADVEEAGFTATSQKEGDMVGYQFTKHYNQISDFTKEIETNKNLKALTTQNAGDTKLFTVKKGFFKDTYTVNFDANLESIKAPEDQKSEFANTIFKNMISQMDFKFKSTLPVKTISNNASKVSGDGKSLEWQLMPGQKNPVKMEFTAWNVANIAIVIVVVLILLFVLLFLLWRSRKKSAPVTDVTDTILAEDVFEENFIGDSEETISEDNTEEDNNEE